MGIVTDDITIEAKTKNRCLKIKPSSHKAFGNPNSVKACIIGNREISGGIRLDMEGLLIEDKEGFDDFKWFEIDFQTLEGTPLPLSAPPMSNTNIPRNEKLPRRLPGRTARETERA